MRKQAISYAQLLTVLALPGALWILLPTSAKPPTPQAKHGLTGSYYISNWDKDVPPPAGPYAQVWHDPNDFRLPKIFTAPVATRVDAQVAFGQGKGFSAKNPEPPIIWWPTASALPAGWIDKNVWNYFAAAIWKGYIHLPKSGTYYFGTVSNGGSAVYLNQARVALNGNYGGALVSDAFVYAKEDVQNLVQNLRGGDESVISQSDPRFQYVVPVSIDAPRDLPIEVRYNPAGHFTHWANEPFGIDLFWVTPDSPRDPNGKPIANIVPSEALYTEAPGPIEKPVVRSANSTISADFLYFPMQTTDQSVTLTIRLADKDGNPIAGKRVALAGVGAQRDEIVQPDKPTDEKGETTAGIRANASHPAPHDSTIFATEVTDFVDVAQVAHVTFVNGQNSFFPQTYAPYYDGKVFLVEPLPFRVGQRETFKIPLINRLKNSAEVAVSLKAHGWNIGVGAADWEEVGRSETFKLKPGETHEVTVFWTPNRESAHLCFRMDVVGRLLTAGSDAASNMPTSLAAMFTVASPDSGSGPGPLASLQRNLGAVEPAPNSCEQIDPKVIPGLRYLLGENMCEFAKRTTPIYRAKSEELSKAADDAAAAGNYKQAGDLKNQALNYGYAADCGQQYLDNCRKGAQSSSSGPGPAEKAAARERIPLDEKSESIAYARVSQCRRHPESNDKASCDVAEKSYESALAQLTSDLELANEPPQASYQRLAVAASDTPSAYTDSVRVSLERYRGAQTAGDTEWMARHLTAMRLYEKRLADSQRRRAAELEQQSQSLPPDNPEALATQQVQLDQAWPEMVKGDLISSDQRQKLAALGFTETQLNNSLQRLRSLKQAPKLTGPRATLLDSANTEKEFADFWQRASEKPVGTGAEGQQSGSLSQTYAIANPHDRQETVELFIRPISIPADWKLSIVNAEGDQAGQQASKPGSQPKYPVHEIDPGKHYNITLPAKAETKVASVVIPVGEVGARTTARWAVEGRIGDELIGGMVHEMNVPYIIADLQLPPVGSKEVEGELPVPSKPWVRIVVLSAVGISIIGMLVYFFIFWRRRRRSSAV